LIPVTVSPNTIRLQLACGFRAFIHITRRVNSVK
jgi:hypothetical protein